MPLRNVVARMLTADSPPRTRTRPTSTLAKRDQPPRHAAFGHDRAGQHEERDGQHRDLADAVGDFQHHRFGRNADPQRAGERAEAERVGDRHADREAQEQRAEEDQEVHGMPCDYATGRCGSPACVGRPADGEMLDDEQQREDAAERNRRIDEADRQRREFGDLVVPGRLAELDSRRSS